MNAWSFEYGLRVTVLEVAILCRFPVPFHFTNAPCPSPNLYSSWNCDPFAGFNPAEKTNPPLMNRKRVRQALKTSFAEKRIRSSPYSPRMETTVKSASHIPRNTPGIIPDNSALKNRWETGHKSVPSQPDFPVKICEGFRLYAAFDVAGV